MIFSVPSKLGAWCRRCVQGFAVDAMPGLRHVAVVHTGRSFATTCPCSWWFGKAWWHLCQRVSADLRLTQILIISSKEKNTVYCVLQTPHQVRSDSGGNYISKNSIEPLPWRIKVGLSVEKSITVEGSFSIIPASIIISTWLPNSFSISSGSE